MSEAIVENNIVLFEQKALVFFNRLAEYKAVRKKMDAEEKKLTAAIETAMAEYNIKSFKNDVVTITRVDPTESRTIDVKALEQKENGLYLELLADYPKITKREGYIRIQVK